MSSNHTNQPSSRPSTRSSHAIVADQTALPVSFTLFLYAGLAGLLLTFVICIVRVFIRHFYLCNFKPNYNGAESSIEIIREASIEVCDLDTHHATVVRRLSVNSETYIESVKGLDCTSIDENVPSTRCCSRSASALSIDSSPLAIADRNSVLSNTLDPESGTNNVRGCCLFSRSSPPVSNGYPVTGPTASVMNVMESVSEFPNFGKIATMFFSVLLRPHFLFVLNRLCELLHDRCDFICRNPRCCGANTILLYQHVRTAHLVLITDNAFEIFSISFRLSRSLYIHVDQNLLPFLLILALLTLTATLHISR